MLKIHFEITTPERTVFKNDVDQISLPTAGGEITILPNHIPLVSILVPGELKIQEDYEEHFMAVSGGLVEVRSENHVVVLADSAERAEEIDEDRARKARERARKLMEEKRVDDVDFATFAGKLEKELARLKVVRRRKAHGGPSSGM